MEPISNKRIILKPLNIENLDDFLEAIRESEKSVGAWLTWWKKGYSVNEAKDWFDSRVAEINAKKSYNIGIFQKDDDRFVGGISINHIDTENRIGSIGYWWIRESFQNQGIASTAVNLIKDFGFNTLGLVRLEIVILEDNAASRKVAEKCGAKLECIAKNRLIHKGKPGAAALYSLISP
jgi:ribosomal-protein-serine acetyltransferase